MQQELQDLIANYIHVFYKILLHQKFLFIK
jgi:hypothetical protein